MNVLRRGKVLSSVPLFPQPAEGHLPVFSEARHAPSQRLEPSEPYQSVHDTSSYFPVSAPFPDGKNAPGAPDSWHRSKLQPCIVKHPNHPVTTNEKHGKERYYALHRLTERVGRFRDRLAAPLLIALDGAEIGNLYDDAFERAIVAWRVRVRGASHPETPPTRIPGTEAWRSTEGKLVHRGRIAGGGFATCYGDPSLSVCALEAHLMGLTRRAAARVECKRRSARRILHVVAVRSEFEERTTVHGAGEKEERNEGENRFHGG